MQIALLFQLYLEFAIIGLFSIGGGLATLPFLSDLGQRTNWFTAQLLADMVAISESTPGAIGLNMATYVGYNVEGIFGGIVATVGLITPSIIIILFIAKIIQKFKQNPFVNATFMGLRPASTALIAVAWLHIAKMACNLQNVVTFSLDGLKTVLTADIVIPFVMGLCVFLSVKFTKIHPVLLILACAVLGIVLKL